MGFLVQGFVVIGDKGGGNAGGDAYSQPQPRQCEQLTAMSLSHEKPKPVTAKQSKVPTQGVVQVSGQGGGGEI